ncbi:unnamed protein product (macronuclear) [Paramecium tetraurelia]|uniref:Uncharacterized protein n=1 Tax=Paramecium tetraurelia TaxID=5888 RepID=A0BY68_PARTE|nr:uncharacterized protein GSPATT00033338001 [Paramecium tetraurelia]CAK63485.1 unnamed protein product [Paramecium tetraurelia]|eukprot:XP_001430883.1 hypothetical protein (macronuclear) [Paramecium tetraurelia strain d4-2]
MNTNQEMHLNLINSGLSKEKKSSQQIKMQDKMTFFKRQRCPLTGFPRQSQGW